MVKLGLVVAGKHRCVWRQYHISSSISRANGEWKLSTMPVFAGRAIGCACWHRHRSNGRLIDSCSHAQPGSTAQTFLFSSFSLKSWAMGAIASRIVSTTMSILAASRLFLPASPVMQWCDLTHLSEGLYYTITNSSLSLWAPRYWPAASLLQTLFVLV